MCILQLNLYFFHFPFQTAYKLRKKTKLYKSEWSVTQPVIIQLTNSLSLTQAKSLKGSEVIVLIVK